MSTSKLGFTRDPPQVCQTLPSGLRTLAVHTPGLRAATLAVFVRVGARDEQPESNGVSHLLEHMMFRGSRGFESTLALNLAVEPFGGSLNAATGRESTSFFTSLHPSGVARGLEVFADMLLRPTFDGLELERQVVLDEILDEVDDEGRELELETLSKRQIFGDRSLGLPIGGTATSVATLGREDLTAHWQDHFVAAEMVVAIAGDVDLDGFAPQVEAAFAEVSRQRRPVPRRPFSLAAPRHVFHPQDGSSQVQLLLSFPGPPETDPRHAALIGLSRVLDDGLTSRLHRAIVEEKGLAYLVSAGINRFTDVALFEVEVACAPDRAVEVAEEVRRLLSELMEEAVSNEELARAKHRHELALEFTLDSSNDVCCWHGLGHLFGIPTSLEQRIGRVNAVTPQDLQKLAQELLAPSRGHLTTAGSIDARTARKLERTLGMAGANPFRIVAADIPQHSKTP
jgi:predicted Zn-dependent peptidase